MTAGKRAHVKFSWQKLPRPILALAPMSGYTDSAFRQLVKGLAPEVVCFTGFVSAEALAHDNRNSQRRLTFADIEQPLIVQIFGSRPDALVKAAKAAAAAGAAGIDVNMGCPARKVLKSGSGASLVKDWPAAAKIVKAVKHATALPVSVKTRIGWDNAKDALEFASLLVESGADLLTIHGRTALQQHEGDVDWEAIYQIKKTLPVPILGNGGIKTPADIKDKLGNLDGVMIGRAALTNPWIFTGRCLEDVPLDERARWYLHHAELAFELEGERGIIALRKHLMQYTNGLPAAKKLRALWSQVKTVTEVADALAAVVNLP